ncbi:hypothetical protein [Marinobacter sp.]|uniref:hypothetical protein n=1 Tax=Marinobacter sp. TaxID=50741 RepID=UPI0019C9D8B4|nr:hypothetical protein [Marinobacter sp.]MBC7191132.1 hypothetical protein [Marinobacter sp.]
MNTRKHLLVASMTFALAACGGGGGGGSEPAPPPPERDIVGGTASSVDQATVGIYEWDGQAWSETPIATTTTDSDGRFVFNSVAELSGPVRFELTSTANTQLQCESPTGCGNNAEAGDYYPAPEDYKLNTLVNGEGLTTVALSPVTNMAAQWAMDMPRGVTVEGIKLSNARIQALFGLDSDFTTSLPTTVADDNAISTASAGDRNHAIVSAAFADLSEDEGYSVSLMVQGSARMYSLLGGQVLTGSGELSTADIESLLTQYPQYAGAAQPLLEQIPFDNLSVAGLDRLMASAGRVVSGLEEGGAFDSTTGDSLRSGFNDLVSKWNGGLITDLAESTDIPNQADFDKGKALLNAYDDYRRTALEAEAGIDAANRNLGWLYIDQAATDDTVAMLTVISDVISDSITASICLPNIIYNFTYDPSDCQLSTSYSSIQDTGSGYELRAQADGTLQGQAIDLTIPLEDIRNLLANNASTSASADNQLAIPISGTITNSTSVTSLDTTIVIDLTGNDFSAFPSLSDGILNAGSWSNAFNNGSIDAALTGLVEELSVNLTLTGDFEIAKAGGDPDFKYSVTGIDTSLFFNRRVITQSETEPGPLLTFSSSSTTENPAGETKGPIDERPMYRLQVEGDALDVEAAYRLENIIGLPPMELEVSGGLSGYPGMVPDLAKAITRLLEANPEDPSSDGDSNVYAELQDLLGGMDFSTLALSGDNELRIYSEDGTTVEQTYLLTTEADGGVSITKDAAAEPEATLYIRGAAGYLYTNDTLVAVVNISDRTGGLVVNLVDGDQRTYTSNAGDDEKALQAATWTLLESLFSSLFSAG